MNTFKKFAIAILTIAACTSYAVPLRPHQFYLTDARFNQCLKNKQAMERVTGKHEYYEANDIMLSWRWRADGEGNVTTLEPLVIENHKKDPATSKWLTDAILNCKVGKPEEWNVISIAVKFDGQ